MLALKRKKYTYFLGGVLFGWLCFNKIVYLPPPLNSVVMQLEKIETLIAWLTRV